MAQNQPENRPPVLSRRQSTASALALGSSRSKHWLPERSAGYVELNDVAGDSLDAFERRRQYLPELAARRRDAAAQRHKLEKAIGMITSAQRIWCSWRALRVRRVNACRPEHFALRDGRPADWGTICFHRDGVREPAPYIRLSDTCDVDKVVGLVASVWRVRRARVVISLTGGAQELNLKPHVQDMINRGLVRAAQQSSAWIVTGGTDTGVMKLVGEAVRDYQADVPCIGVATWGVVHGREQLASNRGAERFYRKHQRSDETGSALQPNHTHFLLVDTGKEGAGAWGGEIRARMGFERSYCARFDNVPMVLVVIGGGAGTLTTIQEAVSARVPVVLISDSGGAPATVAHYMRTRELITDPRGERGLKPPELRGGADVRGWRERMRMIVAHIVRADEEARVLTSFSMRASNLNGDLDLVLLQAMLFATDGSLRTREASESRRMLQLAIQWGRREIAQQWMEKSGTLLAAGAAPRTPASPRAAPPAPPDGAAGAPARRRHSISMDVRAPSVIVEEALRDALLLALRVRKADIVDLLLQQDVKPEELALLELWKSLVPHLRSYNLDAEPLHRCLHKWDAIIIGAGVKQLADAWDERSESNVSLISDGNRRFSTGGWISTIAAQLASKRWQLRASDRQTARGTAPLGGAASTSGSHGASPPLSPRRPRKRAANFSWARGPASGSSDLDLDPHDADDESGAHPHASAAPFGAALQTGLRARQHARAHALYGRYIIPFLADAFGMRELRDQWTRARRGASGRAGAAPGAPAAAPGGGAPTWRVPDLMYWALLNPLVDDGLVRTLWRHSDEPIRMALCASHIASRLGALARFATGQHDEAARQYEGWACGVLSRCANEVEARWLLQRQFSDWPNGRMGGSLITLAIRTNRKAFIAHQHAQSLLDAWWTGDLAQRWDAHWQLAPSGWLEAVGPSRRGRRASPRGATCLGERSASTLGDTTRMLLHALTGAALGLVHMEPTHAAKYHYYHALVASRAHPRSSSAGSASSVAGAGARTLRAACASPSCSETRGGGGSGSAAWVELGTSEVPPSIFAPEVWREIRPPRVGWRAQASDFYSAPFTKFVLRTTCYVAFLLLYALVLIGDEGTPAFSRLELVFFVWALTHALDELHQLIENRARDEAHFDDQGWNVLDALMFWVLFPLVIALRVAARISCCAQPESSLRDGGAFSGGGPDGDARCACALKVYSRLILAVNAVLCFIRFLANYRVHKRLGVLIHVIRTMFNDIQIFVYILAIVVFGFSVAFGGIAPPRHLQLRADGNSPFMLPLWNLFDLTSVEEVSAPEMSSAPVVGMGLLAIYLFISQILLVNLLIAMMNQSYAQANKNAQEEWAASRASSVQELLTLLPVPPPFSLPYLLVHLGARLLRSARTACGCAAPAQASPAAAARAPHARPAERRQAHSAERKFLHEYLDMEAARGATSTEQRIAKLHSELDRLSSLVESAASDRADANAALERIQESVAAIASDSRMAIDAAAAAESAHQPHVYARARSLSAARADAPSRTTSAGVDNRTAAACGSAAAIGGRRAPQGEPRPSLDAELADATLSEDDSARAPLSPQGPRWCQQPGPPPRAQTSPKEARQPATREHAPSFQGVSPAALNFGARSSQLSPVASATSAECASPPRLVQQRDELRAALPAVAARALRPTNHPRRPSASGGVPSEAASRPRPRAGVWHGQTGARSPIN